MRIGLLHSRIRVEEKLLLTEFQRRDADVEMVEVRNLVLSCDRSPLSDYDVILNRCVSHSQSETVSTLLSYQSVPCINTAEVTRICGNKIETSAALSSNGVPVIKSKVALTPEAALSAIEEIGYPVVIKPVIGSWGRLLAKINDRDAAEAILEHKSTLGSVQHSLFYIQPFIEKGVSDIRSFVIGDETICAVRRRSEHWITNTARGATTENCPITNELNQVSLGAAKAVGGGMLAVDLFETADGKLIVNEVNSSMEFRNSSDPTNVNIPERMVDYVINFAQGNGGQP